jgi:putative metalloprotease
MPRFAKRFVAPVLLAFVFLPGCVELSQSAPPETGQPQQQAAAEEQLKTVPLPPAQAQRLKTIMTPLIQHMNHPLPENEIKISVLADSHLNAANAGGGDFYVTSGLLQKATDDQLRGVLAHEIAHADLGHVAKIETYDTVLQLGAVVLSQIWPGSENLTPIAGQLLSNAYSRNEEYEADAHGVEILKRSGYNGKALMADTLSWIAQTEGGAGGGGFFDTHPATGDRIQTVQRMP